MAHRPQAWDGGGKKRPKTETGAKNKLFLFTHKRQIKLMSSDGQVFEVEEEVANESLTVKNMIEGAFFGRAEEAPFRHFFRCARPRAAHKGRRERQRT